MVLGDILTPYHWNNICDIVRPIALDHIFPYIKSKRVRSGVLSELFETQSAHYFNSIGISTKPCGTDKEPDLYFTELEESCEIKVTSSTKREWMGNHISKKSSEYVLISWEYNKEMNTLFGTQPEYLKFSVINVFLDKDDWMTLGEEYNGTKITSKMLDNKEIKVLVEAT
jgi:hypothetical protein